MLRILSLISLSSLSSSVLPSTSLTKSTTRSSLPPWIFCPTTSESSMMPNSAVVAPGANVSMTS